MDLFGVVALIVCLPRTKAPGVTAPGRRRCCHRSGRDNRWILAHFSNARTQETEQAVGYIFIIVLKVALVDFE